MSWLKQPEYLPEEDDPSRYRRLRWQVFVGAFLGYAGFYLVRKNFSMAIPFLTNFGFEKGELSIVLSMNAAAYAISRLLMGGVSDRSDSRKFLPLGLILAAVAMFFMIVPIQWLGAERKSAAILLMCVLNFGVGWFNGMGYPPCTRIVTHWFSSRERGTMMAIWNCSHNIGGALVGPMAVYGAMWFGSWFYATDSSRYYLVGTFAFPSAVAMLIALIVYCLVRDTPQSQGLCSIEKFKNDYPPAYGASHEVTLPWKEIMVTYILKNKLLWCIALADAFVFMVRYGCLDWAPAYLSEVHHYDIKKAGWAYFAYEFAAIPGTLLCGWLADRFFARKRSVLAIAYMVASALAVVIYWQASSITLINMSLIFIGFFIYGPIMLLPVQSMDHVPKNASGAAVGLIGFATYLLGTALLANVALGYIVQVFGWNASFFAVVAACAVAILFLLPVMKREG